MNICPKCRTKDEGQFCPECGTKMVSEEEVTIERVCPSCGYTGDVQFCPECGHQMEEKQVMAEELAEDRQDAATKEEILRDQISEEKNQTESNDDIEQPQEEPEAVDKDTEKKETTENVDEPDENGESFSEELNREQQHEKKTGLLKPKILIPCIAAVLIIVIAALLMMGGGSAKEIEKQISETTDISVAGLQGKVPSGWEQLGDSDNASCYQVKGSGEDNTWEAEEKIQFLGVGESDFNDTARAMSGIDDLSEVEPMETTIQNQKVLYYEYDTVSTSDEEKTYKLYVAQIKADSSNFGFEYEVSSDAYDIAQAEQLLAYFQFEEFSDPKIAEIEAIYDGEYEGGIMIDEDCQNITVNGSYDFGATFTDAAGWTVDNPGETKWGKKNKYTIKLGEASTELVIETEAENSANAILKRLDEKISEEDLSYESKDEDDGTPERGYNWNDKMRTYVTCVDGNGDEVTDGSEIPARCAAASRQSYNRGYMRGTGIQATACLLAAIDSSVSVDTAYSKMQDLFNEAFDNLTGMTGTASTSIEGHKVDCALVFEENGDVYDCTAIFSIENSN